MAGLTKSRLVRCLHGWPLIAGLCFAASAAAQETGKSEGEPQPGENETEAPILSPSGAAPSGGARVDGPSVEFIVGGNSTDGAAKVGRLPVIE